MAYPSLRVLPTVLSPTLLGGLPLAQGNVDRYHRRIDYLRISLTDRCNLRCVYCMPASGVALGPHEALLTADEIVRIARAAHGLGFRKFRITGGEPLVVKGLLPLLRHLRAATGQAALALTTNGVRLAPIAAELREAGISRINVSLDTLRPERFQALTRREGLEDVLRGVHAAVAHGFERVKINAVLVRGVNDDELVDLASLARTLPVEVRFIEQMPLDGEVDAGFLGAEQIARTLAEAFSDLQPVAPESAADAAQVCFRSPRLQGTLAVIAPRSRKFCAQCNRLRLTPHGELKGCLLSEGSLDIRTALRAGIDDRQLTDLLRHAIYLKPLEYDDARYGLDRPMSAIGG